jgi:hypothetical protein
MPRSLESESDGVAAALAIHLCLYCAVAGLFALALYYWMQPTRLPNPGMAALKPSSRTLSYVELLRSEREAAKRDVRVEPEPETVGAAAPQVPEPKKAKPQRKTQSASRARPVRGTQPSYPTNYAYQPFSGDYRPMY